VKIPVDQKVSFLESISKNDDFKVLNQEIVFCEESIIFDFNKESDVNKACNSFKDFFKKYKDIKVDKVKKMRNRAQETILEFHDTKNHIRI